MIGIEECLFCRHISKSLVSNVKHMTVEHNFYIPDVEYLTDLEGLVTYLGECLGHSELLSFCCTGTTVANDLPTYSSRDCCIFTGIVLLETVPKFGL